MKSLFTAILIILISTSAFSQNSNAIFFTENGERFKVVLNGVIQNTTAETNVKLTRLPADNYKCRILFEESNLGYTDFNLSFPNPGNEVTWNIKKNNRNEYKVRFVSEVPLSAAPPSSPTQQQIIYKTVPATITTTTTVQQEQTTVGAGGSDNFNMNVGMNTNGEEGNININASGMDGGMQEQTGYSSTTTTTTTHSVTTSSNATPVVGTSISVVYVPGYSGKVGCPMPIEQNEFLQMKETINAKKFEETKLTISKQILKDNCITSGQVRELLVLFDFESSRLDFAKFAYSRTYDVGNYSKLNDAFEFESSVDELNEYINH